MKINIILLLFVLLPMAIKAQSTHLPVISVKGNQFVLPDGKSYIFRGLNTSDPERLSKAGHWNKAYFEEMKAWGANIVRFPVHPTAWRRMGKKEYLKTLDEGVQWATDLGLYVIVDWHSIGNLRTEMYQSDNYDTTIKETYDFWRIIAQHYKGNTTVAFFEIFNEPTIQRGQLGTCSWADWKALMEEIIAIIRANNSKAIPLVAGFNWAYDLSEIAENPINAEGIAYVSHPYPMKREKPWEEKWTKDWGFVKEKYPLILTEIGFCGAEERGAHIPVISDETYGDALTKYCDEKGISWVVWVFDPQWAPPMYKDWTYDPTRQGVYFKKALLDRVKNNPTLSLYQEAWKDLLNGKDLAGWDTYIGQPFSETNPNEKIGNPIGLNNDPKQVFSIVTEDNEKCLRISGEQFGGISTKAEFENYHLQVQFKWGKLKWAPKKNAKMDSGLLYHANGEQGADSGFWMQSQEFQIQEGDCGDYWGCAGAIFDVPTKKLSDNNFIYDPLSIRRTFKDKTPEGRHAIRLANYEKPSGEWNTLDLYCYKDTTIHMVNGNVVMILYNSKHPVKDNLEPLTKGKIQFQSEGGEVFYKRIRLAPITSLPQE